MHLVFPASRIPVYFLFWMLATSLSGAQDLGTRSALADLSQDIALLDRELRSLKLEVQLLGEQQASSAGGLNVQTLSVKLTGLASEVRALRGALSEQETAIKAAVLREVSKAMEDYFAEIKALLTDSASLQSPANQLSRPDRVSGLASGVKTEFSENFPKSGISYEVQSGDTLSQIALKFGSKVAYIQDANQIVNPARDLRVGDVIFILLTQD